MKTWIGVRGVDVANKLGVSVEIYDAINAVLDEFYEDARADHEAMDDRPDESLFLHLDTLNDWLARGEQAALRDYESSADK